VLYRLEGLSFRKYLWFKNIANLYALKTENLFSFKRIITCIASIPPGKLNYNSISKHIGLDNKTVRHYIHILNETGVDKGARDSLKSGTRKGSLSLSRTTSPSAGNMRSPCTCSVFCIDARSFPWVLGRLGGAPPPPGGRAGLSGGPVLGFASDLGPFGPSPIR
jgi:hypothetical protein